MFLALLAFAYQSIRVQEHNLIKKMVTASLNDSEVVKAAIWNGMMTKDRAVIREIIKAIGRNPAMEAINIVDRNGILRFTSLDRQALGKPMIGTDRLFRNLATDISIRHRLVDDGNSIYVVNPIVNERSCSAASCHAHPPDQKVLGALSIRMPLGELKQEIYASARTTVIFALILFLVVSTVIGLAVVFLVNPNLRRLRRYAGRIERGEYEPSAPLTGSDEIARLSRSFDRMSRKVSERTAKLAEGRRTYKSLFELVPCYLTVVSHDYRIVRANDAFLDQFGDQVGKHCYEGYKGLDERCEACPVKRTFDDGISHESEEKWKVNGGEAFVIVKTAPIVDDKGNVLEVLEMSLDVTQLKRLQMDMRKRKNEYRQLFQDVPCYLTVVDKDFTIVQANKLFVRDFGENKGRKCFKVYKNRDSKCSNCPVEKTFVDGRSHGSEETWRTNSDETRVIVYTAPVTDENGEITAVMEMSTNITEVKRLQSELVVLGETIAGMSHSIKNILSGLQGGVYVVDSGLKQGRQDRLTVGWSMVKRNIDKVSDLVKGILYASKEREPEYQDCDPGALLSDLCDLFEEKARAEGVDLVRDFDIQMDHGLLDAAAMHSALSNLVANALEACRSKRDGGTRVTVSGEVKKRTLFLKVTDDGIGMPQEVKERLFSKFYSTKGSRGTGLGLILTMKVVKEHKGTLKVESELGRGTSFLIEIPFFRLSDPRSSEKPINNSQEATSP